MKKSFAPIAAALALAAAGCADNMGTIQVFQICAAPESGCNFGAECAAGYLGDIVLDVAQQDRLNLVVEVRNQRSPTSDVNVADAYLQEYSTTFDVVGVPAPGTTATFTAPGTSGRVAVTIPASGNTTVAFQAITSSLGAALVPQVPTSTPASPKYVDLVAHTKFKGVYTDQSSFETAGFEFPVRICKGCLLALCASTDIPLSCPPDSAGQLPARTDGCLTP